MSRDIFQLSQTFDSVHRPLGAYHLLWFFFLIDSTPSCAMTSLFKHKLCIGRHIRLPKYQKPEKNGIYGRFIRQGTHGNIEF